MNELVVKLKFLIPTLPKAEKAVAEYMLSNLSLVSDMTLASLSEETTISEATILRFCKRMGFDNYIQLRQSFALASVGNSVFSPEAVTHMDSMTAIFNKVIHNISHSLENSKVFLSDDYDRALNAILDAKSVVFFATGDALISCHFASAKFNRVGIPSQVCSDTEYQYETALRLTDKDVAIAISSSGRSINVVNSIKLAKEHNAFTICITQSGKSPLIKHSEISLFTAPVESTIGRDSVTKRITELTIIESLYLGIINQGPGDYKHMLQSIMRSSEINK